MILVRGPWSNARCGRYACLSTEIASLIIDETRSAFLRAPLHFSFHSLLLTLFLHFDPLFLELLLSIFLVNLGLKRVFHFLLLSFALTQNDNFFVTALKDRALLFKFNIHAVFSDPPTSFEIREVVFRLQRTVFRFTEGRLVLGLAWRLMGVLVLL